eukprot:COSAG04_NODE_173_length_21572_cov_104.574256_7_plen_189_part_00
MSHTASLSLSACDSRCSRLLFAEYNQQYTQNIALRTHAPAPPAAPACAAGGTSAPRHPAPSARNVLGRTGGGGGLTNVGVVALLQEGRGATAHSPRLCCRRDICKACTFTLRPWEGRGGGGLSQMPGLYPCCKRGGAGMGPGMGAGIGGGQSSSSLQSLPSDAGSSGPSCVSRKCRVGQAALSAAVAM